MVSPTPIYFTGISSSDWMATAIPPLAVPSSTCVERGECMRKKQGIASGTRHELCYAIHAEQNAIIQAAKLGVSIQDATLYCTHQPCVICAKMIVNAGISRVVYREGYPDEFARQMLLEGGVKLERYEEEEHEQ